MYKLLFLITCFLLPLTTYSVEEDTVIQPSQSNTEKLQPVNDDVLSSYSLIIVYLILFSSIALIIWQYGKNGRFGKKGPIGEGIHIRETKALGNKQFLVIAEFEEKRYMLGVGPGFIQKVSELEPISQAPIADFVAEEEDLKK